jgi:hypothetical protein
MRYLAPVLLAHLTLAAAALFIFTATPVAFNGFWAWRLLLIMDWPVSLLFTPGGLVDFPLVMAFTPRGWFYILALGTVQYTLLFFLVYGLVVLVGGKERIKPFCHSCMAVLDEEDLALCEGGEHCCRGCRERMAAEAAILREAEEEEVRHLEAALTDAPARLPGFGGVLVSMRKGFLLLGAIFSVLALIWAAVITWISWPGGWDLSLYRQRTDHTIVWSERLRASVDASGVLRDPTDKLYHPRVWIRYTVGGRDYRRLITRPMGLRESYDNKKWARLDLDRLYPPGRSLFIWVDRNDPRTLRIRKPPQPTERRKGTQTWSPLYTFSLFLFLAILLHTLAFVAWRFSGTDG